MILGLHQASLVVAVSRAVAAAFLSDGVPRSRVRVLYNGVDVNRLAEGDATHLRTTLDIPHPAFVASAVGCWNTGRVTTLLIRAVRVAADRGVAIWVLIVGSGPEHDRLVALAEALGVADRVRLLGERTDVGAIYRDASDAAVLATRSEAAGLVLAEASALGLAVVASNVDGVPEIVGDQQTGLLVPPENPVALADALMRLASNAPLRQRLGNEGRQRARERLAVDAWVRGMEDMYGELLGRPAASYGWRGDWMLTEAHRATPRQAVRRVARGGKARSPA